MAYTEDNPRYHLVKMRGMLDAVMRHCREDMDKIGEPKTQALFETTAEVLNGLITTYSRYVTELEERPKIGRLRVFRPATYAFTESNSSRRSLPREV